MSVFSERAHSAIFLTGICLLAVALPVSIFLITVAQITLAVNWLLEGDFRGKWHRIKERKAVWILTLFYLVHLIGITYTSDLNWGLQDLRIKLPMLVLPLVIGTSKPIEKKSIQLVLNLFAGALAISAAVISYRYLHIQNHSVHTKVEVFDLIDYIRLSLMFNLSIFSMCWLFSETKAKFRWIYIPFIIWFTVIVFLIQSLTGIIVFFVVATILLIRFGIRSNNIKLRWIVLTTTISAFLLVCSYLFIAYEKFFSFDPMNQTTTDKITKHGNGYWFDFNKKDVENGHYTYTYICEPELRTEWNRKSSYPYDSLNRRSQVVKYPLIRYLTSKGLRKDQDGVSQLSQKDVRNIEWGMTNYIFEDEFSVYPKVYTAFWELYHYHLGENPTGFSISQRIEALKTAMHIIRKNFWLGVGTGDGNIAFEKQYKLDKSSLAKENQIGAHNQFVTFFLTFGVIGLAILLYSLFAPIFIVGKIKDYLFLLIFIIGFLSFLNEDTLKVHVGISFFSFFYTLFLFRKYP